MNGNSKPKYKLRGYAALYNEDRVKIIKFLEKNGADAGLIQRFQQRLAFDKKTEIVNRFKEAITRDPGYAAVLNNYTVGSPQWAAEVNKIAESIKVLITFIPNPGNIRLDIIGKNEKDLYPIFDVG